MKEKPAAAQTKGVVTMDIWKLCGTALLIAVSALLVRQNRGEADGYGKMIAVSGFTLNELAPLIGDVISLPEMAEGGGIYLVTMLKALAVGWTVQITSDIVSDLGETALARKVEMAGKVAILAVAYPLVRQLLSFSASLMGLD